MMRGHLMGPRKCDASYVKTFGSLAKFLHQQNSQLRGRNRLPGQFISSGNPPLSFLPAFVGTVDGLCSIGVQGRGLGLELPTRGPGRRLRFGREACGCTSRVVNQLPLACAIRGR
jgi:hypothetical protein